MKKVILISGGSDGLGKVTSQVLSKEYSVVSLSPNEEKNETVKKELGVDYVTCDVSDTKSVTEAIEFVEQKYGQVDCLINNAAIWIQGALDEHSLEEIKKVIEVNTAGTIFLTRAVIPIMKKRKSGLIINIVSQAGLYGKAERSVYTASKFALTGFTKCMQPELAPFGIRVTGLYPGKMNTSFFEKVGIKKGTEDAADPEKVAETIKYIIEADENIVFPEVGIKHIDN